MKSEPLPEFDRSLLGKEFERSVSDPVTAEQMIRYAVACGETDPIYLDEDAAVSGPHGGLVATPTFPVTIRRRHFMPKEIPRNFFVRGMDAGKEIEIGVLVRPGDVLTGNSTVHDVYEKTGRSGKLTFLVFRSVITNQREEMVATIDQRMMFR
jgi:acyl dehydratase